MMDRPCNHYELLGAAPDDPPAKIQALYWKLSRQAYPRRVGVGDATRQQQLNEAYEVLKKPERRAAYNQQLGLPLPRPPRKGRTVYAEVVVAPKDEVQFATCQFKRWEPCPRCWGEGCGRCNKKGRLMEQISLPVKVTPSVPEVLVRGQGARSEPKGRRGDLIVYVVWRDTSVS